MHTGRRASRMCVQKPTMISLQNLKTTMDVKDGVSQQMGIIYMRIISKRIRKEHKKTVFTRTYAYPEG